MTLQNLPASFIKEDVILIVAGNENKSKKPIICKNKNCNNEFTPKRSTKKFCSENCRKRNNEPKQNAQESPTKAREAMEYWDRVNLGLENLYKTKPIQRATYIQDYINNPTTAKITCNPTLLRSPKNNIAKVANRFTRQVYGMGIQKYTEQVRDLPEEERFYQLYDYSVFEENLLSSSYIIGTQRV